jgi:hypothetical protein
METLKRILIIIGIMLVALSQQAFTPSTAPMLPNGTQICVDNLPDCYAAKVMTSGPNLYNYPYLTYGERIQTLPRTREWFLDDEVYYYLSTTYLVTISVYIKATSTSSWVYEGSITSDHCIRNWEGNFLYNIEADFNDLYVPPPSPR